MTHACYQRPDAIVEYRHLTLPFEDRLLPLVDIYRCDSSTWDETFCFIGAILSLCLRLASTANFDFCKRIFGSHPSTHLQQCLAATPLPQFPPTMLQIPLQLLNYSCLLQSQWHRIPLLNPTINPCLSPLCSCRLFYFPPLHPQQILLITYLLVEPQFIVLLNGLTNLTFKKALTATTSLRHPKIVVGLAPLRLQIAVKPSSIVPALLADLP